MTDPRDPTHGLRPEQVWDAYLREYAPPHDNDWFADFWPLLQAASAEAVLRALFPDLDHNLFVVGPDLEIWDHPIEELLPVVATDSYGYVLVSNGVPDLGVELMRSRDPTEVAAAWARLVAERTAQA
jgi:hypothetical protein